jgi:hypothetical protein
MLCDWFFKNILDVNELFILFQMSSASQFHRLLAEARGRLSKPPDSMKSRLAKFQKVMRCSNKLVSMKSKLERFRLVMGQRKNSMKARLAKFNRVMSTCRCQKRKGEASSDGPAAKIRHVDQTQASGASTVKVCIIFKTFA